MLLGNSLYLVSLSKYFVYSCLSSQLPELVLFFSSTNFFFQVAHMTAYDLKKICVYTHFTILHLGSYFNKM